MTELSPEQDQTGLTSGLRNDAAEKYYTVWQKSWYIVSQ